ncbi:HAD family hydrolase [Microbacterium gorillae]|uniref:HAD family hydrolase n=1 Tax=Microbacterium gorillae TaxID=1231063 RepID=UPI00058E5393|nr:HAD family hydrolase [Microbacterium gorillae]
MRITVGALLFDIDGTLVDSTPAVERTWRVFCDEYGVDFDTLVAVSHGRRAEDTIADFLPPAQRTEALAFLDAAELADLDGVIPLPGTVRLLDLLPAQRWAAVTSGNRELMTARLGAAGLPVPPVMVTADDVTVGKPDPQGYLRAAALLGVDPAACLVIEDAPAGIRAGLTAGARVLGVATSHDAEALEDATWTVSDLSGVDVDVTPDGVALSW